MIRSIGAVVAGFAAMTILVMVGTTLWVMLRVPGGMASMRDRMKSGEAMPTPPPSYYAYNFIVGLFAAMVGGWLTARIATTAQTGHLIALAIAVLVMGLVSARAPGARHLPGWYKLVIPVVGLAGVALSALL